MFGFEFYHIRIDFFSISSISTRTWDTGRLGRVLPCDIPNEKDCTKCLGIPAFNGSGCYTIDSTHLSNVTKSECVYFTCSPSRTHTQISTHKQALSLFLSFFLCNLHIVCQRWPAYSRVCIISAMHACDSQTQCLTIVHDHVTMHKVKCS